MPDETIQDLPIPPAEPDWLEPETARARLKEHLSEFLRLYGGWTGEDTGDEPPALGLKVSAGLGKTRTALACIAELGRGILKNGHIFFYAPTLDLAEEAEKSFREMGSGLPSGVLRGRDAINPATDEPMCRRSQLAKSIAGHVPSVTRALCYTENPDGTRGDADCASGCSYLKQKDKDEHQVIFLAHAYLKLNPPVFGEVALRIIDEKFWASLTDEREIAFDRWYLERPGKITEELAQKHDTVREIVGNALKDNSPVHVALRAAKVSASDLERLASEELQAVPKLRIDPGETDEQIDRRIETFDRISADDSRTRQSIFDLLAKTATRDHTDRLSLTMGRKNSDRSAKIRTHHLSELPKSAPLIMLDADLDEVIARRFCPNIRLEHLRARPGASVVQVSDQTLSNAALLKNPGADRRRADVRRIIEREVSQAAGQVLVVATKDVLNALFEDMGQKVGDDPTSLRLLGAEARWFGPGLLGINRYETFSTIILIGRLQPPVGIIENQLRALFGDSEKPLALVSDGKLESSSGQKIMLTNGSASEAKVQLHPDDRATSLLRQSREAQSEQAIARLRLIGATTPKRVVVLSNVPLPSLQVDDLRKFQAIVEDKTDQQISTKYKRLEDAMAGVGIDALAGMRLSCKGLSEDAPKVFPTQSSAKEFRRKLCKDKLRDLISSIGADMNIPVTHLDLSARKRGGLPVPAVVFRSRDVAQKMSQQLWPEYDTHQVTGGADEVEDEASRVLEAV